MITKFKENKTIDSSLIIYNRRRMNKIIDGLMQELEDATASDTEISVTDSANALAKLLPSGRTEQNQYEGKNLANINVIQNTSIITINNDTIILSNNSNNVGYADTGKKLSEICPNLQAGDTAIANFNSTATTIGGTKDYIYCGVAWRKGDSMTITQSMLDSNVVVYGGYNETSVISNFMITTSSDNSYEPYVGGQASPSTEYEQPIHKVSGHNEFLVQNENILPQFEESPSSITHNGVTITKNSDGSYTLNGTSTGSVDYILFGSWSSKVVKMKLQKSRVYLKSNSNKLNGYVALYDTTGSTNSGFTIVFNGTYNNTQIENVSYSFIRFCTSAGVTFNNEKVVVQLSYEEINSIIPHEEQTAEFTLEEGQSMYEGDYLADDGIHFVMIERDFDGTENWVMQPDNCFWLIYNTINMHNSRHKKFCNKFQYSSLVEPQAPTPSLCEGGGIVLLLFKTDGSQGTNANEWKAWLSEQYNNGTPLKVIYKRAEEIIVPYTETQQQQYNKLKKIMSHFGGTNITTITAGDLKPILNFSYKKSNRLKDKEQDARLDNIENKLALLES